jgi:cytochrome c peroxidase
MEPCKGNFVRKEVHNKITNVFFLKKVISLISFKGGGCNMSGKRVFFATFIAALGVLILFSVAAAKGSGLSPEERLGKSIFFDKNLSINNNQSCAACHAPNAGWTGPDQTINAHGAVYQGSIPGHFGNRKPPSAAYAGDSPILYYDGETWVGGMFWDGRATGWTLGDPLAEQAQGPFLNPLEQANPDAQAVIDKVLASSYARLFRQVCTVPAAYYECIGRVIAAYERSTEVSQFTSKYDYWLKGKAKLTGQERRGLELFEGKAKCANCHVAPLFTDFTYDNLGVPRNLANPFYKELDWNPQGANWIDTGLGGFLKAAGYDEAVYGPEWGKQKVPTLRNVDLRPSKKFVKAYSHNGYFKSLEEIVHFYNTRDVLARCESIKKPKPGVNCWPAPEVADTINTTELGDLGLSRGEELAIVAFLRTLSDGYKH